jgi:LEA14-like dessication related protein
MKNLLLVVLLFLTACSVLYEKPTAKLKDVHFAGLSNDSAAIDVLLTINNPNTFDLTLLRYTYQLNLQHVHLADGASGAVHPFPGKSERDLRIPVRISYADLVKLARQRPSLTDIPYQLNAELAVDTPIGPLTVPLAKNGTISVPEQYRPGNYLKNKLGNLLN